MNGNEEKAQRLQRPRDSNWRPLVLRTKTPSHWAVEQYSIAKTLIPVQMLNRRLFGRVSFFNVNTLKCHFRERSSLSTTRRRSRCWWSGWGCEGGRTRWPRPACRGCRCTAMKNSQTLHKSHLEACQALSVRVTFASNKWSFWKKYVFSRITNKKLTNLSLKMHWTSLRGVIFH